MIIVYSFRVLDISFNRIHIIEGLDNLQKLEKLFLSSNKISKIENLNHLKNLKLLELGDNKIRVGGKCFYIFFYLHYFIIELFVFQTIENLEGLDSLESLYLGKNKITKIQNLNSLQSLTVFSLQVIKDSICTDQIDFGNSNGIIFKYFRATASQKLKI